jgi:hypothetical protein
LNRVIRSLIGTTRARVLLPGRLRVLRGGCEQASLLGQSALRHQLLALQLLDAVLQLVNFGFVDFQGRPERNRGRRQLRRRRGFLASGQPHDGDHQKRQSDEQPGLHILRKKTLGLGSSLLYFDWLAHG